jgi:hypothetical protein
VHCAPMRAAGLLWSLAGSPPVGEAIRNKSQRRRRDCRRNQPRIELSYARSILLGCVVDLSRQSFTPSDHLSEILFEPRCRGFRLEHPGSRHRCAIIGDRLLFQ